MCLSSTWLITADVGLGHLAQGMLTRFPHYKVTFSFLPCFPNYTLGSKSVSLPEKGYLHNVCGILHRRLAFYLFIQSFSCVSMDRIMDICFILWIIILKYIFVLFCCSNCSSFSYWELFQMGCSIPFISPHPLIFWALPHFFGATRCSGFILSVPWACPKINHFSKGPGSLNWIMILETNIWMLGVLTATGVTLFPDPLSEQSQAIHGYTHFPRYAHTSLNISVHL